MSEVSTKAPDPMDIALGAAVRIRRRTIGMSQEALAEQCGVSFQQIQKYENGANRISFSRLVQIARALRCRVTDLMAIRVVRGFEVIHVDHEERRGLAGQRVQRDRPLDSLVPPFAIGQARQGIDSRLATRFLELAAKRP